MLLCLKHQDMYTTLQKTIRFDCVHIIYYTCLYIHSHIVFLISVKWYIFIFVWLSQILASFAPRFEDNMNGNPSYFQEKLFPLCSSFNAWKKEVIKWNINKYRNNINIKIKSYTDSIPQWTIVIATAIWLYMHIFIDRLNIVYIVTNRWKTFRTAFTLSEKHLELEFSESISEFG